MPDAVTVIDVEDQPAFPVADPEPGDWVYALFWRPLEMPDGTDRGGWDSAPARVVSAGEKTTVVELSANHLPPEYAGEGFPGSFLRYVAPDRLFASSTEALKFSQTLTGKK